VRVAAVTIKGFKLLGANSEISTLNKLRCALEIAGVELIDTDAKSYEDARRATQGREGKAVKKESEWPAN
jgi:hypothetical protein